SRADELQHGLRQFIAAELDHLESGVWPVNLPDGVIHADLFPDNVFFLGARLSGLIDFTFACNDMLAYDVAICLNAWCFESDYSFNVTKARAFLNAYGRERQLSDAEQNALPLLARGAALRFLLTRLVDFLNVPPGALVRPKDPIEYVRKLRFQQGVAGWINSWKRNGWRTADKKPVKNVDLWQRLDAALKTHDVRWHWVKGHAGHDENERADQLARDGIAMARLKQTVGN